MYKHFAQICLFLAIWQTSSAHPDRFPSTLHDTTYLQFLLCPGVYTVEYNGDLLSLGQVKLFHFTGQMGIDSVVIVTVNQAPVVDFWATAEPICPDSTNGVIEFYDNVGITAPYLFSIDGGLTFSDLYTREGLAAGHYELRAKDRLGCVYEYEIEIPEAAPLKLQSPQQVITCLDSVQLSFSLIGYQKIPYTWQWQPPGAAAASSDSVFWAKTPGTYLLTVANACDTVEKTVDVIFKEEPSLAQIFFPNAFSPNGDGINDCFRGYLATDFQLIEYQLFVFNRWGCEVFRSSNVEECWDGSFRGKEMVEGALIWYITAKTVDCYGASVEVFRKGGVTIVQ
jgi:gliding motility-associated-like protein